MRAPTAQSTCVSPPWTTLLQLQGEGRGGVDGARMQRGMMHQ